MQQLCKEAISLCFGIKEKFSSKVNPKTDPVKCFGTPKFIRFYGCCIVISYPGFDQIEFSFS